jgi:hypothetical protein
MRSKLLLLLGGLAVGLFLGEAGLRLVERVRTRSVETEFHPVLGRKLPGGAPGHDERGYRNRSSLARADIVVLGDSQTWGVNVSLEEAWPQQLAQLTGRSVYNVSQGGFGILHYAALFGLARELEPKVVIAAVYLGNDLYDSYRLAYQRDHWASLRLDLPGLERDTLEPRATALWNEHEVEQARYGRADPRLWGEWLQGHTAIGRLLERAGLLRTDVWHDAAAAWARAHPDHGSVCEYPVRTVLTTAYRLVALDASDIRIREGVRLSLWALESIERDAAAAGIRLLVVIIPTKERVHADVMSRSQPLSPMHSRLVVEEDSRRQELLAHLHAREVKFVDMLPELRRAVERGIAVYPTTAESHPNRAGYEVIARATAAALARLGPIS